jgi:hypothetical protein
MAQLAHNVSYPGDDAGCARVHGLLRSAAQHTRSLRAQNCASSALSCREVLT